MSSKVFTNAETEKLSEYIRVYKLQIAKCQEKRKLVHFSKLVNLIKDLRNSLYLCIIIKRQIETSSGNYNPYLDPDTSTEENFIYPTAPKKNIDDEIAAAMNLNSRSPSSRSSSKTHSTHLPYISKSKKSSSTKKSDQNIDPIIEKLKSSKAMETLNLPPITKAIVSNDIYEDINNEAIDKNLNEEFNKVASPDLIVDLNSEDLEHELKTKDISYQHKLSEYFRLRGLKMEIIYKDNEPKKMKVYKMGDNAILQNVDCLVTIPLNKLIEEADRIEMSCKELYRFLLSRSSSTIENYEEDYGKTAQYGDPDFMTYYYRMSIIPLSVMFLYSESNVKYIDKSGTTPEDPLKNM